MSSPALHDFGLVDPMGDFYELTCEAGKAGRCLLAEIIQTERGPRRSEIAVIPAPLWNALRDRVVRELTEGMGETERPKKKPVLKRGVNRLSPLIGRELAVLFWALTETDGKAHVEAILHGWRELAREERWWLFAKAAAPGQRQGVGWRLALFHALSESPDSRATDTISSEKKSPGNGLPKTKKKDDREDVREKAAVVETGRPYEGNAYTPDKAGGPENGIEENSGLAGKGTGKKSKKDNSEGGSRQLRLF